MAGSIRRRPDALIEALKSESEYMPSLVYSAEDVAYEWGASAGARNILIDVALDVVAYGLAWDLLKAVLKRAVQTQWPRADDMEHRPSIPHREQVVAQAKWQAESSFKIPFESLEEIDIDELPGEAWRVQLKDTDRNRYSVEYEFVDGYLTVSRIRRQRGTAVDCLRPRLGTPSPSPR